MPLFSKKKSNLVDPSLISAVRDNLTENSKLVKSTIKTSKLTILPISKLVDYLTAGFVAISLYKIYSAAYL